MIPAVKELLLLLILFSVSLIVSFQIGFQYIHPTHPVIINDLNGAESVPLSNIDYEDHFEDEQIVFFNGYPCLVNSIEFRMGISTFYNTDISEIPTSESWSFPVIVNKTSLSVIPNRLIRFSIENRPDLPVVSVIVNPKDFFSYDNGIYVKGKDYDFRTSPNFYPMPWHRPANFYRNSDDERKVFYCFYDEKGHVLYSSFAMAEISGNATRSFPQKSIRLSAELSAGKKKFEFDFFNDNSYYKSIVLRNGGNDNTKTLFRDKLMQEAAEGHDILKSSFQPCVVYINGVYWGIHFMQNRLDRNFIAEKFDVKEKEITLVENWNLIKGDKASLTELLTLLDEKSFSFEQISSQMDMNSLITYIAFQFFFANTDWPSNNLKLYKIQKDGLDSRWKFAFFDLDYGMGYTNNEAYQIDMFEFLSKRNDRFSLLFNKLMKFKEFRSMLNSKLEELLKGALNSKKLILNIERNQNLLVDNMKEHISRWDMPSSIDDWFDEIEVLKNFSLKRRDFMKYQMNKYLK